MTGAYVRARLQLPALKGRRDERTKVAVPMHYGTFGLLLPDASGFAPKGVEVKPLKPGESLQYG